MGRCKKKLYPLKEYGVLYLDLIERQASDGCGGERIHVLFQIQVQKLKHEVESIIVVDDIEQPVARGKE